ncbi:hypothetical protein HK405_007440, partial [Cladochytrium tenue]
MGCGGGSLPKLFETAIEAVEIAQKADMTATAVAPATPAPAPTSPYASAVGPLTQPSQNAQIASVLASDRLALARENLDTLAAFVASALFQVQYALAADAAVAYLCVHALRPSTPDRERRLVHVTLGLVKSCQYLVYFLHESVTSDGIVLGPGTLVNLFGFSLSVGASYWWGWRVAPVSPTSAGKRAAAKPDA